MTDIDTDAILRGAFTRAAEPGDPAGVAEAIRTRLAAGDTGTPAAPVRPPIWSWFLGAVLAVLVVVAAFVFWPHPVVEPVETASPTPTVSVSPTPMPTPAPSATPTPTPTPTPAPTATPTPSQTAVAPAPPPPPPPVQPTPDTEQPVITQYGAAPTTVCTYDNSPPYADHADVTVSATDNVGVTSVEVTWSGATSGAALMTLTGTTWLFSYNPPSTAPSGTVTFIMRALDAAGNSSGRVITSITLDNQCLI